jgi:hypothetical protein
MKNKTSSKKVPAPFSLRQIAHRLYPLGPILVLVALTACCSIEPGTRIVSNTLAPDCTYDLYVGYSSIRSQPRPRGPPVIVEVAAKFTAMSDGNLATVYLGLTKSTNGPDSGGPASVFLYGDAAGSPDIATQTLLGTVAPTEVFGTTNKSLVSLPATGRVLVVKGRDYWVVLKPAAQAVSGTWNRSLPEVNGSIAWSGDDVTWEKSNDTLPAFRITAWPPPWSKFFRPRESPFRVPE